MTAIDESSPPAKPRDKVRALAIKIGKALITVTAAYVVAMAGTIAANKLFPPELKGDEKAAAIERLKAEMPSLAKRDLQTVLFTFNATGKLQPDLVYEGKTAKVLFEDLRISPSHSALSGERPLPDMTHIMLTITPAGRYVRVDHTMDNLTLSLRECRDKPQECLRTESVRLLDPKEAMELVYRSPQFTPQRFREIFGVEPPATRQVMPA